MPRNVAVQFFDRVDSRARTGGLPLPGGRRLGVPSPGSRPATRSPGWPPACSRSASSPSSASASRPAPATSGSSPTSRSCAPVLPPRRSTRPPWPRTSAYILSDSECRVVFAEDDTQIAKLVENKAELPHLAKVVTFDGTDRRRLGDQPGRPRDARRRPTSPSTPTPSTTGVDADRAGPAGDADLHLRHDRAAQGRAAAARVVDLRGRGDRRPGHPDRGRPAVPVAADGPLVRQGADLDPARRRLRRPPSTAASTRSSTTWPS